MLRNITYFGVVWLSLSAGLAAAQSGAAKAPPNAGPIIRNDAAPLPAGARLQLGKLAGFRYAGWARTATMSLDGKLLAVVDDRGITIVNTETGKVMQTLKTSGSGMTFSADKSTLAIQSRDVTVWDVTSGKQLQNIKDRRFPGFGRTGRHDLNLSTDGKIVGSVFDNLDGKRPTLEVKAIEVSTGKTIGPFKSIHKRNIGTAVAPDGKTMLSWGNVLGALAGLTGMGNDDAAGIIQVWDLVKGQELRKIKLDAAVKVAAYAPDGKTIAVAVGPSNVYLIDFETGKETRRFAGEPMFGSSALRFSPDGRHLVAFETNGGLQAWDVADGKRVALVNAPVMPMLAVGFPAKGRVVAMGMLSQTLCWWDATDAKAAPFEGHLEPIAALAFSADGQSLITASKDLRLIWWDSATGKEQRRVALGPDRTYRLSASTALATDGKRAATFTSGGAQLWDLKDAPAIRNFRLKNVFDSRVHAKFSADGSKLSAVGSYVPAKVWDANTGQEVFAMPMAKVSMMETRAAVSPDGKILAVHQFDGLGAPREPLSEIVLWDLAEKKELRRFSVPAADLDGRHGSSVSFSADGKFLAVPDNKGGILVLHTATGRQWHKLTSAARDSMPQFAFSPDGRFLAAGSAPRVAKAAAEDPFLEVWEIASGQKRAQFQGHVAGITCVAFSPDGATIATGSLDTTVLLWDFAGKNAKPAPFAENEISSAWKSLTGAPADLSLTMRRLTQSPATVAFLKQHLQPVKLVEIDPKKLAGFIADLGAANFQTRELATQELKQMGERAEGALRKALAGNPTVEASRRIQSLLDAIVPMQFTPQELQAVRGIEILERIATPAARDLLAALSKGDPLARATQDATTALKRLK